MSNDLKDYLISVRRESPDSVKVISQWNTEYAFRKPWELLRDKLSFKDLPGGEILHFHDLRHVYAVKLRQGGCSSGQNCHVYGTFYSTGYREVLCSCSGTERC